MASNKIVKLNENTYTYKAEDGELFFLRYERKHWKFLVGPNEDEEARFFNDSDPDEERAKLNSLLSAFMFLAINRQECLDDILRQAEDIVRPALDRKYNES